MTEFLSQSAMTLLLQLKSVYWKMWYHRTKQLLFFSAYRLDIISDKASFSDTFSNVEPHQHFGSDESISEGILLKQTK